MRFIFLGTGTSAGVPAIACDCEVCTSEDPRDRRTRTGACVQWTDAAGRERVVLIDTTPDLREQALRHRLRRCDAILFTHNHVDHVFGLDEVRRFNAVMQAPIDIYAEKHTMDSLRRVYQHVFDAENNVNKSFVATLIAHEIKPDVPIDLWGLRFTPLRLMHGRLPILGWRIDALDGGSLAGASGSLSEGAVERGWLPLAYCTDVSAFPPDAWGKLTGLRTLVLDALRWRHHPTHQTIDQAVQTAQQIGAEQTWFVHMAHQVKHSDAQERMPEGVGLAWDGLTLE
ncbi:MAG: MBL fold metallo-hydrolase [Phycisphaeraceae bacterium]|nr:MAG: MBL fold metallo-hydrolase [Phycisphaeraceae bacterium]